MTEFELFQSLKPLYPAREYALIPQAGSGTGAGAIRHCDALALNLWPSRGMYLSGFEIKTYRGDWLRELKNPKKDEEVATFCNYWWIVASGPFVKADELPQTWGLLMWDKVKERLHKEKAAPFRKATRPDLPFLAAMLRKAQDVLTPDAALAEARKGGYEDGVAQGKLAAKHALEDFETLQKHVREFHKASGVDILAWHGTEKIGRAVRQVLEGSVGNGRETLLRVAERLIADLREEGEAGKKPS